MKTLIWTCTSAKIINYNQKEIQLLNRLKVLTIFSKNLSQMKLYNIDSLPKESTLLGCQLIRLFLIDWIRYSLLFSAVPYKIQIQKTLILSRKVRASSTKGWRGKRRNFSKLFSSIMSWLAGEAGETRPRSMYSIQMTDSEPDGNF